MTATLYRKYRPDTFQDVLGQPLIVKTIINALTKNRVGQAYLFTGPRGTGKTTLARLLAKAVTCSDRTSAEPCLHCEHCVALQENRSLDVIEIDAASNTGVDNIRDLRDSIKLLPTQAKRKVYIIDEVHMLSIGAFNALLKTLEEPPAHAMFILATTAIHKVPDTVQSRCQRFDFSRISTEIIAEKLERIAQTEKVKIDKDAMEMIALASNGGLRDAESLLSQVISFEDKHITAEKVSAILGIANHRLAEEWIELLKQNNPSAALDLIDRLVTSGSDPYLFAETILRILRQALLASVDRQLENNFSINQLLQLIDLVQTARNTIRSASIPQLPLEIAALSFLNPIEANNQTKAVINTTNKPDSPANGASGVSTQTPPIAIGKPSAKQEPAADRVRETRTAYEANSSSDKTKNEESSSEKILNLDTVQKLWNDIVSKVRETDSPLSLTLGNSRPLRVENSAVILGVRFPIYREKLEGAEKRLTIERAFDTILGVKTSIRVVLDNEKSAVDEAVNILGGTVVA